MIAAPPKPVAGSAVLAKATAQVDTPNTMAPLLPTHSWSDDAP